MLWLDALCDSKHFQMGVGTRTLLKVIYICAVGARTDTHKKGVGASDRWSKYSSKILEISQHPRFIHQIEYHVDILKMLLGALEMISGG